MSDQTSETVDRRELIRLIDMGIQVEAFIHSDLGRYLLERSNAEQKAADRKSTRLNSSHQ